MSATPALGTLTAVDEYPQRLGHKTPAWVQVGAVFHIRIRVDRQQPTRLVDPTLASDLLGAVQRYHQLGHWWCDLFLLMPDHVHGLIRFPYDADLAKVVGNWKRGVARFQGVRWQGNFFDHRIRHAQERQEKWKYIRRNPVVKGLCAQEEDWPWWWAAQVGGEEAR